MRQRYTDEEFEIDQARKMNHIFDKLFKIALAVDDARENTSDSEVELDNGTKSV